MTKVTKRATKPKFNVDLLRKVARRILREPRRFNMEFFSYLPDPLDAIPPDEFPPCGTQACIAGHADWLSHPRAFMRNARAVWGDDAIRKRAMKELRLSERQAERLFYTETIHDRECWPTYFVNQLQAADTPLDRARVAVARINHFIATNGAE